MKSLIIDWAKHLQYQVVEYSRGLSHPVTVSIRYAQLSMSNYANQVNSVAQVGQLLGRDVLHDVAEGYDVIMQNKKVLLKVFMLPRPHYGPYYEAHQIASLAHKVNAPIVELHIPMYK